MVKSADYRTDLLKLLFQNVDFAGVGDAGGLRGSVAAGSFWIAAHYFDPTISGHQESFEMDYIGYARQSLARSAAGWNVVLNSVINAVEVVFPANLNEPSFPPAPGKGEPTAKFLSIGTSQTGQGQILYTLGLVQPILVQYSPFQMRFLIGEIQVVEF